MMPVDAAVATNLSNVIAGLDPAIHDAPQQT
jgi:hypothetical protein